jgi:hypothetical protein
MRSRASVAASLDASFCCFCLSIHAITDGCGPLPLAFTIFTFPPFLNVRHRIAQELTLQLTLINKHADIDLSARDRLEAYATFRRP